jgi:voltage-gated potassium channel
MLLPLFWRPFLASTSNSFWFKIIELVSAVFFTAEWILRVWSSVERSEYFGFSAVRARMRYIVSPLSLIDIIAVVPLYLAIFDIVSAESLIALRLLPLLQLVHFFSPLVALWKVIRSEAPAMMGTIFIVFVLIVISASGMYLVERGV